jgi:hypothetical protein
MKIKASSWLFFGAILFTITTLYWYLKYDEDTIGILIYAFVSVLFYIGAIGNLRRGN